MGIRLEGPAPDSMTENRIHVPVLLERTVALLAPALDRPGAVLVDCTLGLGGHSAAVLERLDAVRGGRVAPAPEARHRPGERVAPFGDRFTGVLAVYDELREVLDDLGLPTVDGVLFDLGGSSMQLDV